MIHFTSKNQRGMGLLEMVIFVGLIATIFLALIFATTQSLKKAQFNQRKIVATHLAEEVAEWMRGEKETDWAVFAARSPATYCMNVDLSTCDAAGSCWSNSSSCAEDDYSLNGLFRRTVALTTEGSRVNVTTHVYWLDGPNIFEVPIITTFSRWE